jgi:hypothetical protein
VSENEQRHRDTDLLKVQVLTDYSHSRLNLALTLIFTIWIALITVFVTLVLEGHINYIEYDVAVLLISAPLIYWEYATRESYYRSLDKISGLIEIVENGESLPSLSELRKGSSQAERQKS